MVIKQLNYNQVNAFYKNNRMTVQLWSKFLTVYGASVWQEQLDKFLQLEVCFTPNWFGISYWSEIKRDSLYTRIAWFK